MKTFLKILIFLFLFVVCGLLLLKLINVFLGLALIAGILAILGGLLYVMFGPETKPESRKIEQEPQLSQVSPKSVEEELKRRRKEMQS